MKKILGGMVLAVVLLGAGCGDSIEGTWQNTNPNEPYQITFSDGQLTTSDSSIPAKYRLVEEADPKQLYIGFNDENGDLVENPFAIYKIENGKLILKFATEYTRTIGVIPVGTRYEFPTDFSGEIEVLER